MNSLINEMHSTIKERFLNHFMYLLSDDFKVECDQETLLTCFIEFALLFELIDEEQEDALLRVVYQDEQ